MTALALKSLWARKVRALITTLAVMTGVAFVVGAYVLTDTIFAAFDEIFTESLRGTNVVITAKNPVEQESGQVQSIPDSLLGTVQKTPGVRLAAGSIFVPGGLFDAEGNQVGSKFAPKFISSTLPDGLESLDYVEGHPPRGPTEASLDQAAADDAGISIGDTLEIVGQRRVESYRVTGLTKLGEASFGGASIAQLTLPEAQRITDNVGRFVQISVAAEAGVPSALLKSRILRQMPSNVRVETGQENASRLSGQIRKNLGFFRTILLVFGGVAVFVGAFLIFNTFSITVAQRITEFGMLRTLGASRGQLVSSVLIEALAIGIAGSALGIAAGLGLGKGLQQLFISLGLTLPMTTVLLETRTVVIGVAVGMAVTLASSLIPAVRSTQVPPIAALHGFQMPLSRRRRVAYATLATLLAVGGVAMLAIGLFGGAKAGTAAGLVGGGAVLVVLAVSLFSPRLVGPLASVVGIPLERIRSLIGRLARENTQRNPSRTAVTAAALMIGLAVVTFVMVFAAGLKSSVASAIDEGVQGQLVIRNVNEYSPIPAGVAAAARRVPGVELVATLRSVQAKEIGGPEKPRVSGLDLNASQALTVDWTEGDTSTLEGLTDEEALVNESFASSHGLDVGDTFRLLSQTGRRPAFEMVGEYSDRAHLLGSVVITQRALARDFRERQDSIDFVKVAPGADVSEVQSELTKIVEAGFPSAEVSNQQELKESQEKRVDELVTFFYALLGLAILVSLFGIANTLALSIHERTRELGMLRAIGMSRRQVRAMVRYEAVITAVIGAVLGMALGVVLAALMAQPLKDEGFNLSYPIGSLLVLFVLAGLAGVVAAILPARWASQLDVLQSLQYE